MGFGAFHPRQLPVSLEIHLTSAPDAPGGLALPTSFFHSGDVLNLLVHTVTEQRGTDAQKKFKGVTGIVSVVAIETIGTVVDCELGAEADIDAVAMRQVADVTDRVTAHRKDA